jgi:hypothetical protein
MRNRSPGNPAKDYAADRRRKKGVDPVQTATSASNRPERLRLKNGRR